MTESFIDPMLGVPVVESPFFAKLLASMDLPAETHRIATDLHEHGFACFDFPEENFDELAEEIINAVHPKYNWPQWHEHGTSLRLLDEWKCNDNIRNIAINTEILKLLKILYGRRPVPFQTLNFPVGTQQHFHSDCVHFTSWPERFMCGVWVALEDMDEENGPLVYYPGSHRLPIYTHEHLGSYAPCDQGDYEAMWRALVDMHELKEQRFFAKKGQALIWASNLLHGGSPQADRSRTRHSQVTHYYFENCCYYTLHHSDPFLGRIAFKQIENIATGKPEPNRYHRDVISPEEIQSALPPADYRQQNASIRDINIPEDFDPELYLERNPDVAQAGVDPIYHYKRFGRVEGRPFRKNDP